MNDRWVFSYAPLALLGLLLSSSPSAATTLCDEVGECADIELLIDEGIIPHPRVFLPDLYFFATAGDRESPASFAWDDELVENNAESWQEPFEWPVRVYWHVVPEIDFNGTCVLVYEYHYYFAQNKANLPPLGWHQTHEHDWEWIYVVVGAESDGTFNPYMISYDRHKADNHDAARCGDCVAFIDGPFAPPGRPLVPVRDFVHPILYIDAGNAFAISRPASFGGAGELIQAEQFGMISACAGPPAEYESSSMSPCSTWGAFYFGDRDNCVIPEVCRGRDECADPRDPPWNRESHWDDPYPDDPDVFDIPDGLSIAITATDVVRFVASRVATTRAVVEAELLPDPAFLAYAVERSQSRGEWERRWRRRLDPGERGRIRVRFEDDGLDPRSYVEYRLVGEARDGGWQVLDRVLVEPVSGTVPAVIEITPRPARSAVTFRLDAAYTDSEERIRVFDVRGREVRDLEIPVGARTIGWDLSDEHGRRIPAGVYFASVGVSVRRVVVE
jgi:hypothetical protein